MLELIETDLRRLPDLSGDYPLTPEQIEAFRRDGFAPLPGVCSLEEIAAYRPVIQDVARRLNREVRRLEERDTYGPVTCAGPPPMPLRMPLSPTWCAPPPGAPHRAGIQW
jgi:hypothetical protein